METTELNTSSILLRQVGDRVKGGFLEVVTLQLKCHKEESPGRGEVGRRQKTEEMGNKQGKELGLTLRTCDILNVESSG